MARISYQNVKVMLSLGIAATAALGCSANDAGNFEQPPSDVIEIRFRTVGTGYRGESLKRADGKMESRPAPPEKEAKQ